MTKKILTTIIILIGFGIIVFLIVQRKDHGSVNVLPAPHITIPLLENIPELTETYNNKTLDFSFKYPQSFKVNSVSDESGENIVVQNEKGQGIQIHIQTIDDPTNVVTVDMIKKNVPDLSITNAADVLIGRDGKGVAFESDNKLFNSKSREVWFAYEKHFYQISTYLEYDELLKAIFATWQFKK